MKYSLLYIMFYFFHFKCKTETNLPWPAISILICRLLLGKYMVLHILHNLHLSTQILHVFWMSAKMFWYYILFVELKYTTFCNYGLVKLKVIYPVKEVSFNISKPVKNDKYRLNHIVVHFPKTCVTLSLQGWTNTQM